MFLVKIEGKLDKLDKCHSIGNTTQGQNSLFAHHLSQPPLSLYPPPLSLLSVGAAVNYLQWPQNVYQHEEHNSRMKLYNYIKVRFKVYCEILMPEVQKPKTKTASVLLVWLSILKTKGTTRLLGSRASKPTRFWGRKWSEKKSWICKLFRPASFPASGASRLGSLGLPWASEAIGGGGDMFLWPEVGGVDGWRGRGEGARAGRGGGEREREFFFLLFWLIFR